MKYVLIIAVAFLLLGGLTLVRARSRSVASHERDGYARLRATYGDRYPEPLLRHTYAYLADRHGSAMPHYEVLPGDDLQRVYQLADLDLEDAVLVIADRVGGRIPTAADLDGLKGRVKTVDDLLRYLEPFAASTATAS